MTVRKQSLGLWLKVLANFSERQITWVAAVALLIVIPAIFISIALVGIFHLEQSYVIGEMDRAEAILENETERVDQILYDWSAWNDTYQFVQDHNQAYLDDNISPESMASMKLDFFLLVNRSNQTVLQVDVDRVTKTETEQYFTAAQLLENYPSLFEHNNPESNQHGLITINDRVMLVASRPVLTSQYEGPIQGTLIYGVWLDEDEMQLLSHLIRRQVLVHSTTQAKQINTPAPGLISPPQSKPSNTFVKQISGSKIAGYRYLNDIRGQEAMLLQVNIPREIYQQGISNALLFLIAAFLIGIVLFTLFQSLTSMYLKVQNTSREYLERYQAVVQQSTEAIMLVDEQWNVLEANPASQYLLGLKKGAVPRASLMSFLKFDSGDNHNLLEQSSLTGKMFERQCQRRDGERMEIEISASKITYLDGFAYSLIIRDITRRNQTEKALRASEERFSLATRGANDGLWDWNLLTDEIYYSSRWKSMLGFSEGAFSHSPHEWLDRIHPEDRARVRMQLAEHLDNHTEHFQCEHRVLHHDGSYRWMLTRGVAVWREDGTALRIAGSQTDITDRKMIEEQLRYDALHDGLTGLANRTLLLDRLNHINDRKRRFPEMLFALFFLDFDRFKQINDTLGHQYGDLLLIEASRRLETCLRMSDTVARCTGLETLARIAGDEFVILLEDLPNVLDAHRVAERIRSTLNKPFVILGEEIKIGVSIGIVIPDQHAADPEEIIRNADIAMYNAKQKGGAQVSHFTRDMFEKTAERMRLESELHHAVETQAFKVVYQPIFTLKNDHIMGFEALLRWSHPQRGLLTPPSFVDVAEETGLIVPIGYQVLREACHKLQEWHEKFNANDMIVSVNMSTRQLLAPNLAERVRTILEEERLDPQYLWIEVTENILTKNLSVVQTALRVLSNMGIKIIADDFGTGSTPLNFLQTLQIDGIKIDQTFVQDLDGKGKQIIDFLVPLGHTMGLLLVAEGVETEEQKAYLRKINCDTMQGFLMCGPLIENHADRFLLNLQSEMQGP